MIKKLAKKLRNTVDIHVFLRLYICLLVLSCFVAAMCYVYDMSTRTAGVILDATYLGKMFFASIVLAAILTITIVSPAFAMKAFGDKGGNEPDRQVRVILSQAYKPIFERYFTALVYPLLLILAVVPLEMLALIVGNIALEKLILAQMILLATAFAFTAFGLAVSSLMKSQRVSDVLIYATTLTITFGLPLFLWLVLSSSVFSRSSRWVRAILFYGIRVISGFSPVSAAVFTEIGLRDSNIWFSWLRVDATHRIPVPSAWIIYVIVCLIVVVTMLRVAVHRERQLMLS